MPGGGSDGLLVFEVGVVDEDDGGDGGVGGEGRVLDSVSDSALVDEGAGPDGDEIDVAGRLFGKDLEETVGKVLIPFVGAAVFDGVSSWVDVTKDLLTFVLGELVSILGIAGLGKEDRFAGGNTEEFLVDVVITGVVAFLAREEVRDDAALR